MSSRRPNIHLIERPTAAHIFAKQFSELPLSEAQHRVPVTFGNAFDNLGGWPNSQTNNYPAHANQLMGWEAVGDSFDNDLEGYDYSTEEGDQDEDYEQEDDENEDDAPRKPRGRLVSSVLSNFRLDIPRNMFNALRSDFGGIDEEDGHEDDHKYPDPEEAAVCVPLRPETSTLTLRPRVRSAVPLLNGHSDERDDAIEPGNTNGGQFDEDSGPSGLEEHPEKSLRGTEW